MKTHLVMKPQIWPSPLSAGCLVVFLPFELIQFIYLHTRSLRIHIVSVSKSIDLPTTALPLQKIYSSISKCRPLYMPKILTSFHQHPFLHPLVFPVLSTITYHALCCSVHEYYLFNPIEVYIPPLNSLVCGCAFLVTSVLYLRGTFSCPFNTHEVFAHATNVM